MENREGWKERVRERLIQNIIFNFLQLFYREGGKKSLFRWTE